jgi:TfoX/Sxy family transcriptional regulator of competence genes
MHAYHVTIRRRRQGCHWSSVLHFARVPSTWRKAPPGLIESFERAFPPDPRAERRLMFGYPAGFVNGNMFTGVFQESLFVRLDEAQRAELLEVEGAALFEPMKGRPMREYVVLPVEVLEDDEVVRSWVGRALTYGASLPPRASKGKAPPTGANSKSAPKSKTTPKGKAAARKPAPPRAARR